MRAALCRFGYEEYDGARYCFEHYGFWHGRVWVGPRRPGSLPEASAETRAGQPPTASAASRPPKLRIA